MQNANETIFFIDHVNCTNLIHVSAGENAIFSCATELKLSGLTATWMKDNKPIGDAMADRVKIVAKDNVFTLTISSVKDEDKGQYTCRVSNANGEAATCSAQLEVHQRKSQLNNM